MDNRIVFAVAGAGKTSLIIDNLKEDSRALIITYTVNNTENLKLRVLKKFGFYPRGIQIYTYYQFLYRFCCRPVLGHKVNSKGIIWTMPPQRIPKNKPEHYMTRNGYLYGNRIAKLLCEAKGGVAEVRARIEKYFDHLLIDEVQDFAGNDFNFLTQLAETRVNQLLVGDYFQHTFDTSRDGMINRNLHIDFEKYRGRFEQAGYVVDTDLLSHSYRCSPTVCDFVTEALGIEISSHRNDQTYIGFTDCPYQAKEIYSRADTIKLFYQSSDKYVGLTRNWGATKGEDCYQDVCVVLNAKTWKLFHQAQLHALPAQTKNKLYVACTRAKGDIHFIPETKLIDMRS